MTVALAPVHDGKGCISVTAAPNQLVERHRSRAVALLVLGGEPATAQGLDRAAIEPLSSFVGGSRCVSSDEAPPPKQPNNPPRAR